MSILVQKIKVLGVVAILFIAFAAHFSLETKITRAAEMDPSSHPCYLTGSHPAGRPIKVNFDADVVDGQGNFVRNLTQEEKNNLSFDLVLFFPGSNYGGVTGQFENSGQIVNGVNKLGSYNLDRPAYSGLYNIPTYRIINIKPPSGLVIRSISGKETNVDWSLTDSGLHNVYYYFPAYLNANWFVVPFVCPVANPNLKPELNITFHLTVPGSTSGVKIEDKLLYAQGSNAGLSFVKRFVQTYGNPTTGGDLEAGYLEPHSDFRFVHGGEKPFPTSLKIVKFNNKPYLFVGAHTQVLVFDISNPQNPILKSSLKAQELLNLSGIYSLLQRGNVLGSISLASLHLEVSDDAPYALAFFGVHEYGGLAMIKINPNTLKLTVERDLIFSDRGFSGGPFYSHNSYKGSDGKTYYVAVLPANDVFRQQTHQGNKLLINTNCSPQEGPCDRYVIFTLEEGEVNVVAKLAPASSEYLLWKEKYGGTSNPDYLLKDSWPVKIANISGKAYLFAQEMKVKGYGIVGPTGKIKIFDISDPQNISEIPASINLSGYNSQSFYDREKVLVIDESAKRLYTTKGGRPSYPSSPPQASAIFVYDLSSLPERVSLVKSYDNVCSLVGLSENVDAVLRLKEYLQIPSSVNIIKVNCPVYLDYGRGFSASDSKVSVWPMDSLIDIPNSTDVEYGYHSGYGFEVIADLKDLSQPKVLGLISSRKIFLRATGVGLRPSVEQAAINNSTLFYDNRYIFRALTRTADVWELKNTQASSGLPPSDSRRQEGPSPAPSYQPNLFYRNLYRTLKYTQDFLERLLYGY